MDSYERLGGPRLRPGFTPKGDKEARERRRDLKPQPYYPMPNANYPVLSATQTMSSSYMGDKKPDEPGYPLPSRFDSPNPVYGSYTVPPKPYQPYQSDVGYQQYPPYPVPEQPIYQPYRPPGSPSADQSSVNPYRYDSKGTGGHVDREEQPSSYVPPQDHYVPPQYPPQQDSGLYPSETNAQQSPYGFDAENGRRRRKGPKQPRPAVKEPLTFELNPLEPQDVTIHMSLDATDDVEDVLEEFSRLRRLGRFNDAARHFDAHLEHFLDNKHVLTQYGRFLAERVNSSEFAKLAKRFPPQEAAVDDALELNWDLLVYLMGLDSDVETPVLQDIDKLGDKALDLLQESFPNLDSTEVSSTRHEGDCQTLTAHRWSFCILCSFVLQPRSTTSRSVSVPTRSPTYILTCGGKAWCGSYAASFSRSNPFAAWKQSCGCSSLTSWPVRCRRPMKAVFDASWKIGTAQMKHPRSLWSTSSPHSRLPT